MRFLADENILKSVILRLRAEGLNVKSVLERAPGVDDPDVIELARREDSILLTLDSDIGTHLFMGEVAPPPGVVYFRLFDLTTDEAPEVVLSVLREHWDALVGSFVTYRNGRTRSRPLRSSGAGQP